MKISTCEFYFVIFIFLLCGTDLASGNCNDRTNSSCGECVKDFDCYWCMPTNSCNSRPSIKPSSKECDGKWYGYGQCAVSGNLLLIIVPICLFVILVIAIACIYCCCCRQCLRERRERKWAKEDSRTEQKNKEREDRHTAKQEERRIKHDQIRMKYGIESENMLK